MRYTRYDIKKRNRDNYALLIVLFSVLIASYLLGSWLSSIFIKNAKTVTSTEKIIKSDANKEQNNEKQVAPVKTENVTVRFICIQNGLFENKDNADLMKNKVKEVLNPFSIKEDNKIRILSGIFKEGDAANNIQLLSSKGIDNSVIKFEINKSDKCDAETVEIISGYVEILTKLLEKDVKSIQTVSFKQYVNTLEKIESTSKNYTVLEDLKKHINGLPDSITKDKMEESYVFLYDILKRVTGK